MHNLYIYLITIFEASVFPDPLSPTKKIFTSFFAQFFYLSEKIEKKRDLCKSPLTRYEDARVSVESFHVVEGSVRNGKDVRRTFVELLASILLHVLVVVDVNETIGVYRYDDFTDVSVDLCAEKQ